MSDESLIEITKGYRNFYRKYSSPKYKEYREKAALAQSPKVMFITCSDSRVNPAILMRTGMGEVFLVCNVANIVPPYRPDKGTHHSTSSALEFAVGTLKVEHIVIMGHSGCGGIHSLIDGAPVALDGEYSFIAPWVEIITEAKHSVSHLPKQQQYHACECEALKISLANLATFPWIAQKIEEGNLKTHAWHFDIASGVIVRYDKENNSFIPLTADSLP